MRIGTGQLSDIALKGLQQQDNRYADLMVQLASGKRVNKLSDDPIGSLKMIGLEKEEASFKQWQKNADNVIGSLSKAEGYLDSSYNIVLRVQDLVLTANSGSATQKDRESIITELETLKETMVDFANSTDSDGNYVFSGSQTDTPPIADTGAGYVYQGDNLTRTVPVSAGRDIPSNVTVEDVYFQGGTSFFDDIDAYIADIQGGSATIGTTGPALLNRINDTIDGIGRKLTDIGGNIIASEESQRSQQELSLANEQILNKIENLDYAEAMTEMNTVQTTLSATQKAYSRISQLSLFNQI